MKLKKLFYLTTLLFCSTCGSFTTQTISLEDAIARGKLSEKKCKDSVDFTLYRGSLILFNAKINNEDKQFIYDNGCSLTLLQKQEENNSEQVIDSYGNKIPAGLILLDSLKMGKATFLNTLAYTIDIPPIFNELENFGGFVGTSIIAKLNWKIDFVHNRLFFSDQSFINDTTFEVLNFSYDSLEKNNVILLTILGDNYKTIVDLGSSQMLKVPVAHPLTEKLSQKYTIKKGRTRVLTVAGSDTREYGILTIPMLKFGGKECYNVRTSIEGKNKNYLTVGASFFKNKVFCIDNTKQTYAIKNQRLSN